MASANSSQAAFTQGISTMLITLADVIRNDPGTAALLPGGIYDEETHGIRTISRTNTPDAFDEDNLVRPCCVVAHGAVTPVAVIPYAQYEVVEVWYYAHKQHANMLKAVEQVKVLLDRTAYRILDFMMHDIRWAGDVKGQRAPELNDASLVVSRFQVWLRRTTGI